MMTQLSDATVRCGCGWEGKTEDLVADYEDMAAESDAAVSAVCPECWRSERLERGF